MLEQELELSVRPKRWTCVVDPMLALTTPGGAQLVQRLSAVADLWMVRSFWQVLDSSEFYRRDPLALWTQDRTQASRPDTGAFEQALALWEGLRAQTDLASLRLHWLSDSLTESSFPEHTPPYLLERYESLHQALSSRVEGQDELSETAGFFAALDCLALTAALGSVRLLTLALDHPWSCLGASCKRLGLRLEAAPELPGGLLDVERRRFGDFLVSAGTAPLVWAGLSLAVVQLVVPRAVCLTALETAGEVEAEGALLPRLGDDEDAAPPSAGELWQDAKAYWYGLAPAP